MAGTGKTCTTRLLLGKPPPEKRDSTGVTDTAKRVRNHEIEASGNMWKEVTLEELEEIVVKKISSFSGSENDKDPSSELGDALKPQESTKELQQRKPDPEIIRKVHENVTEQTLQTVLNNPDIDLRARQILGSNWIYVIDSGGQPQFHNLLPLFINGISIALYVFRLSDKLSDRPLIKWFSEEEEECDPIPSELTILENFKYLKQSIQTHNLDCRVLCVGTHYDVYKRMVSATSRTKKDVETIDEKKKLLGQDVVCIDACTVYETERKEHTEDLRSEFYRSMNHKEIKVPTWWYLLELKIMKADKKIISYKACKEIADELRFHSDALKIALKFFHKHHIFHYYPEFLPEIVFCRTQVLLDIVTMIVRQAMYMKDPNSKQHPSPQETTFKNNGIITSDFLSKLLSKSPA